MAKIAKKGDTPSSVGITPEQIKKYDLLDGTVNPGGKTVFQAGEEIGKYLGEAKPPPKLAKSVQAIQAGNFGFVPEASGLTSQKKAGKAALTAEEKAARTQRIGSIISAAGKGLQAAGYGWQGVPYTDHEGVASAVADGKKAVAVATAAEAEKQRDFVGSENADNRKNQKQIASMGFSAQDRAQQLQLEAAANKGDKDRALQRDLAGRAKQDKQDKAATARFEGSLFSGAGGSNYRMPID